MSSWEIKCGQSFFIYSSYSLRNPRKHEKSVVMQVLIKTMCQSKAETCRKSLFQYSEHPIHDLGCVNSASKLPILLSMTSKCPSLLFSLPPSFQSHSCSLSLPGNVPLGFLALKGQKQTWSWQATHSPTQGFLITEGRGREQEEDGVSEWAREKEND